MFCQHLKIQGFACLYSFVFETRSHSVALAGTQYVVLKTCTIWTFSGVPGVPLYADPSIPYSWLCTAPLPWTQQQ